MLKKMVVLATAVAALVAFAVPASASAAWNWTHGGVKPKEGQNFTHPFEGTVGWSAGQGGGMLGSIYCGTKATITTEGPTKAQVTQWESNVSTCVGKGWFACSMSSATRNVSWTITIEEVFGSPVLRFTKPGGNITFVEEVASPCSGPPIENKWESFTATPTLDANGKITSLELAGWSSPQFAYMEKALAPVGSLVLGLKKF